MVRRSPSPAKVAVTDSPLPPLVPGKSAVGDQVTFMLVITLIKIADHHETQSLQ